MQQLRRQIEETKTALVALGRMRPGSLSKQRRARGTEYLQLSYSHKGKGHTEYVRPHCEEEVRAEVENYKTFRQLCARWVELELALSKLKQKKEV